jgi:DTW domain-containing protein
MSLNTSLKMRESCYSCYRPQKTCLCESISQLDTGIKFVVLIHPREARKQRTGTGRLTYLSLLNSELICGIDFTENTQVNSLLRNPRYFPVVLFPGPDAVYTCDPLIRKESTKRTLLVFLIDATWSLAAKMMKKSRNLQGLPKLTFEKEYRSLFQIKKQPQVHCLSTIESAFYLIEELKESGKINRNLDQQPLLNVFLKMVNYQINCKKERMNESAKD